MAERGRRRLDNSYYDVSILASTLEYYYYYYS